VGAPKTEKRAKTRRRWRAALHGLVVAGLLVVACFGAYGSAAQSGARSRGKQGARSAESGKRSVGRPSPARSARSGVQPDAPTETQTGARPAGEAGELRVAPPEDGEIVVENRRGGVRVEVREGAEVTLSYEAESRPAGARRKSPVAVERSAGLLSIKVARASAADAGRVDLSVGVPPTARLKVYTSEGELSVEGVPAVLVAQTISGGLRLNLPSPPDVRLTAQSLNGKLLLGADLERDGAASREVRGKFQARWGDGTSEVNLFSGRGSVEISAGARRAVRSPDANVDESDRFGIVSGRSAEAGARQREGVRGDARPPVVRAVDEPQEVDEDEVVRVESDLVTMNFGVVERASGRGIKGLTASDFRLTEDGVVQTIEHFEAAEAPFDLLLLLDLSGSTVRVTDIIRSAALRFVAATRPQDRIAVIAFAGETAVVSPLTADRAAVRSAVARMASPQGGTRLYDSLASAFDFVARSADPARRRAIVLMSDGLDSTLPNVEGEGSTLSYAELLSRAQEFDGVLYTVWTSTEYEAFSPEDIQPETFDLAHNRMAELAEAGGGLFYAVERLEDLAGAYERVVADLGTVYSLSYRPTNSQRDGSWRAIRVTIPRRPEAVARGRRGYFAR
jgi:VWFA-related protein